MRLLTLTLATLALVAPIASANAAPPVRAGVLQCQGGQNVGFVVGSVTSLECVFRSEGRRPEPYIANVQRIGLDLGVTEQTQLVLGRQCAEQPARARRTRRQLWRRRRQCVDRRRRRRQLPGRRSRQCLRAAADQPAGPDRPERRRRHRRHRAAAGPSSARAGTIAGITVAAEDDSVTGKGPRKRAFFVVAFRSVLRVARNDACASQSGTACDVVA